MFAQTPISEPTNQAQSGKMPNLITLILAYLTYLSWYSSQPYSFSINTVVIVTH